MEFVSPAPSCSVEHLTSRAARLFARALDRRFADGASSGPLPVLLALAAGNALAQKQLAHFAAVEQSTMAKTLGRMHRDELISSKPDPADRRSSLVTLTSLGVERAATAQAVNAEVDVMALTGLSADEQALFKNLLLRVINNLEVDQQLGAH